MSQNATFARLCKDLIAFSSRYRSQLDPRLRGDDVLFQWVIIV